MRKFYIFPIFVFLLFGITVDAQNLIQRTPETKAWKEFTAADGSFKILFPKPPEILWKEEDLKSKHFNIYVSNVSPTEKYSLIFEDYPAPVVDEMERRVRYGYKTAQAKTRAVWLQDYSGVEYRTDSNSLNTATTNRLFIVKQRFFILAVTTPLPGKLSLAARQAYQRKINAFFDSFTIGKIPPAKYRAIPLLPVDFGSNLQENTYRNKYFGFKISLPPNWKIERLHQGKMSPTEKSEYEKEDLGQQWLQKNSPTLIRAVKEPKPLIGGYSGFLIKAFRPDFPTVSLQEFAEERKVTEEFYRGKLNLPVQPVNLNERKFLMFELIIMTDTESQTVLPLKERWYITERNDVFLTFNFRYRDKADETLMMESLKTLTFIN